MSDRPVNLDAVSLDAIWHQHSSKVLATLIRLLRDFDLAEEALHDAFLAAARKWPEEGVPVTPSAWLISTGRFRAIDRMRQDGRLAAARGDPTLIFPEGRDEEEALALEDDQLRLIFACCHPALPAEDQVALTLRMWPRPTCCAGWTGCPRRGLPTPARRSGAGLNRNAGFCSAGSPRSAFERGRL
ncbi:sigma factor [Tabrizicola sp. BL-A-41-H6]|uniref:sigma factor n=1 Tax=Tabrizicola sp. BL-A-41-H6 TaxID=3421107 RepID=UPI003D66B2CD